MFDILRGPYRRLMTLRAANHFAWKSAYAGKWVEWCKANRCSNVFSHPHDLHAYIIGLDHLHGPINYLEFGVHKGESIEWWVRKNRHPDSRFVGFDSFQGLPADWRAGFPKGHFSTEGKTPDISDQRCSFRVGWFYETLPKFVAEFSFSNPTVVNVDADLYGSSIWVLFALAAKLKMGDILIFDDFSDSLHVFRAFTDFLFAYPIGYDLIAQHPRYVRVALQIRDLPSGLMQTLGSPSTDLP